MRRQDLIILALVFTATVTSVWIYRDSQIALERNRGALIATMNASNRLVIMKQKSDPAPLAFVGEKGVVDASQQVFQKRALTLTISEVAAKPSERTNFGVATVKGKLTTTSLAELLSALTELQQSAKPVYLQRLQLNRPSQPTLGDQPERWDVREIQVTGVVQTNSR